jgi:pimeloyl-ACP methyl ester carboxylesterase
VAFNDLEGDAHEGHLLEIVHSSAAILDAGATYEPWTQGVPCGYLFCTDDNILPFPVQQRMVQRLGPDTVFYVVNSGHCPHNSAPKDLISAVKAVERRMAKKTAERA